MLDNMFQGNDAREKVFFMHIIRVPHFFSNELIKGDKGIFRTERIELKLFISALAKRIRVSLLILNNYLRVDIVCKKRKALF